MRRLTTHWDTDDGATLVFAAVILVAILALSAFAIDFGRMWEERRQLQNGADAAALAIAEDCARGLCDASYDEYATAEIYVDSNARDGLAWAQQVDLDLVNQTVTVYNATEDPGGDNTFDMLLAGIVGFDGFTVTAKATAAWGYSNDIATIPLIISMCEFEKGFPDGPGGDPTGASSPANLFDEPRLNPSDPAVEWLPDPNNNWPNAPWFSPGAYDPPNTYPSPVTLTFHDAAVTDDCAAQAGQDRDGDNRLPGGFGWLEVDNTDECLAAVYDEIWASSDTGNGGPPPACDPVLDQMLMGTSYGGIVAIPVYEDFWEGPASGSGPCGSSGKCYKIATHVAFHVVGYKLSSGSNTTNVIFDPPVPPPTKPSGSPWPTSQWEQKFDCVPATPSTDEVCLLGYFVDYVDNGGSGGIGGTGGIKIVKLID